MSKCEELSCPCCHRKLSKIGMSEASRIFLATIILNARLDDVQETLVEMIQLMHKGGDYEELGRNKGEDSSVHRGERG